MKLTPEQQQLVNLKRELEQVRAYFSAQSFDFSAERAGRQAFINAQRQIEGIIARSFKE